MAAEDIPLSVVTDAADAEGKVNMVILAEAGHVILRFQRSMLWVKFERDNAAHVGKCLIDTAVSIGAKVVITVPNKTLSKEKRDALVMRALHVQRSMTEKGRPPVTIAEHVVDSILSALE